jgi:hypothetical protein
VGLLASMSTVQSMAVHAHRLRLEKWNSRSRDRDPMQGGSECCSLLKNTEFIITGTGSLS